MSELQATTYIGTIPGTEDEIGHLLIYPQDQGFVESMELVAEKLGLQKALTGQAIRIINPLQLGAFLEEESIQNTVALFTGGDQIAKLPVTEEWYKITKLQRSIIVSLSTVPVKIFPEDEGPIFEISRMFTNRCLVIDDE